MVQSRKFRSYILIPVILQMGKWSEMLLVGVQSYGSWWAVEGEGTNGPRGNSVCPLSSKK